MVIPGLGVVPLPVHPAIRPLTGSVHPTICPMTFSIQTSIHPIALPVQPMIDPIAFAVQPAIDAVPLLVELLGKTVFTMIPRPFSLTVQTMVESVAFAIQTVFDAIPSIIKTIFNSVAGVFLLGGQRADDNKTGKQQSQDYRTLFHDFPPCFESAWQSPLSFIRNNKAFPVSADVKRTLRQSVDKIFWIFWREDFKILIYQIKKRRRAMLPCALWLSVSL